MGNDVCKKAIENLPSFFESRLEIDVLGAGIFEPLRKIFNFDESYIFFLNPESVSLKYIFGKNRNFKIGDSFLIDKDINAKFFAFDNILLDDKDSFIQLLNLKSSKSFLIIKLIVKNVVFGFILLCKNEINYYNQEDLEVSKAVGVAISYNLKDVELSELFKYQLKALKDSIIQTKSAYKTIREQNVKIVEADKIKTEFLANVSHELRTPLNAIIGFSESLSSRLFGSLTEKQADYVEEIRVSGIHLLEMINEILDISKIEAREMKLHKTNFLISSAVNEVVNVVKPLMDKKNIAIKQEIDDCDVIADFQKIKQIMYNLLSNAIKFSPEKDEIEIKVYCNKKNLFIEVKDNGGGISPKDQNRIFEKFVQLENTYTKKEGSTGLGLTITKELVEMHKGEISVKSKLNKGSTFIVKLPCLDSAEKL